MVKVPEGDEAITDLHVRIQNLAGPRRAVAPRRSSASRQAASRSRQKAAPGVETSGLGGATGSRVAEALVYSSHTPASKRRSGGS